MILKAKVCIILLAITTAGVFFTLNFREGVSFEDIRFQYKVTIRKEQHFSNSIKDENPLNRYVQDENLQDKIVQDNIQDKNTQDESLKDKNVKDRSVQDGSLKDKNVQDNNTQDKKTQGGSLKDNNVKDKSEQDNIQAKIKKDGSLRDKNIRDENVLIKSTQGNQCGCKKCFSKDDKLLMSCFNPSIEPFLSVNTKLSENVFQWWKYERRDFSYYKATVAKLFTMFPSIPDLGKPSPGKCRTCAVVGNSVNLKGSGYGPLIDHHDIIIRMNAGPTKGYEKDVGTRTTHHVMYPESAVDLDNSTHLVVFAFKIQDLEWSTKALTTGFYVNQSKKNMQDDTTSVMVVNPAFMKYVHEVWMKRRGTYPSTGFMTLVLALHVCDEVDVFGFGADSNRNWSHYFEVLKNKKYGTGPHSGTNEYRVLKQLANEKTVKLYKGS
uniref:CMP-N-acetylneuraminate-beta-galactosamide-alpha-2,3-sialyltransferase 1-like n=1 Tax=Cyprinodon variegatus TaxID=28743 RepID=A0A3Q2CX78_CYPVA